MNILAIDIGGTMIKYGLVSSDGKILSTNKIKTEASKGLNNILNKIDNIFKGKVENILSPCLLFYKWLRYIIYE